MSKGNANDHFRAGLVQMCSGRDVERNVRDATALVREAAAGGASYVQTPEVTTLMELDRERLFALTLQSPATRRWPRSLLWLPT